MDRRPSVFIGSSTEGLAVAEAIQQALDRTADVELWTQGVFDLSYSYLESLLKALDTADFAILVLTPDDVVSSRRSQTPAPRDNVLLELGLFMGRLGRERCFFVYEQSQDLKKRQLVVAEGNESLTTAALFYSLAA
jgi:predicted nucleotide-binding protein